MTDALLPLVYVTHVEAIGDPRLRLGFEDGQVGDVVVDEHGWRGVSSRWPIRRSSNKECAVRAEGVHVESR